MYHLGIVHVAENAISSSLNNLALIFPLDKEFGGGRLLALIQLLSDAQVPTLLSLTYWISLLCCLRVLRNILQLQSREEEENPEFSQKLPYEISFFYVGLIG